MTFLVLLALLIGFLYLGMPMFAGMLVFAGAILWWEDGNLGTLGEFVFAHINVSLLVAIPLFMLMAHFMVRGRVVDDLYAAAHTYLRHLPGGLGIATVVACTVFAAVSGSSVATALTIGAVAIPQMLKLGYEPRGVYGVVAAGGTLGILIPPSSPMILHGVVSDTSIGALFMAGVFPGLLLAAIFALWCTWTEWRREQRNGTRHLRPRRASLREMGSALKRSFWAMTLPPVVLGGIYFGIVTTTEAAAIGALWAAIVAVGVYRNFGWRDLWEAAQDTARTTAMLFMVIVGAGLFGYMLTKLRIPDQFVQLVIDYDLGKFEIILATMAVILPVLAHLDIDKVWYGVLLTINLELALISPPVGMNLIVIKTIAKVPLYEIDRAAVPYIVLMFVGMAIIIAFPAVALWLPQTMALGR